MRSAGATDTKIILIVEEHVPARERLAEFVRRLGFIAVPAADPESAAVIADCAARVLSEDAPDGASRGARFATAAPA